MRTLLFLVFFFVFQWVEAQVPVGQWRTHFPFRTMSHVTESHEAVYAASNYAVIKYDKEDNSIERLDKINGLSDVRVTAMDYNEQTQTVIVGYQNGNIDLIKGNTTINMNDIVISNVIGSKQINGIFNYEDRAYLACAFGIVVLNIERQEVSDTYLIGPNGTFQNILAVQLYQGNILALTENDIRMASLSTPVLADFSNWGSFSDLPPRPASSDFNHLLTTDNRIFLNVRNDGFNTDSLYVYEDGNWSILPLAVENDVHSIRLHKGNLTICLNGTTLLLDNNLDESKRVFAYGNRAANPRNTIYDGEFFWIADGQSGFAKARDSWNYELLAPSGPYSSRSFRMDSHDGVLLLGSGGVTSGLWGNQWNDHGLFIFKDEKWSYANQFNQDIGDASTIDIVAAAIHRGNSDKRYFGSWYNGLFEMEKDKIIEHYTPDNSPLQCDGVNEETCKISTLIFDDDDNLWMTAGSANVPIFVKTPEGEWHGIEVDGMDQSHAIGSVAIDNAGHKWFGILNGGILVYDDNGTPEDDSDDRHKYLNTNEGQGDLPTTWVQSITKDQNGALWIGTNDGIAVFFNPENIFEENAQDAQQIFVQQDGLTQLLMENQVIRSIAVDGANRKWFGTEGSGVFLMSSNGTEQVHHFTSQNSPLLSNVVYDVNVDGKSGEVFFATDQGLISYRGDATDPEQIVDEARVFPNPVRPGYEGLITIDNLAFDSDVSIADAAGNIVYKTSSKGGRATWDGKNLNGQRVASGVYLIFASSRDGEQTTVAKLMFIN